MKCKFGGSSKMKSIKKTINFVKDMGIMKIARSSGGRGGDGGMLFDLRHFDSMRTKTDM